MKTTLAMIVFLCSASLCFASSSSSFFEDDAIDGSARPHRPTFAEAIQTASNQFAQRRLMTNLDFQHLPLATPARSNRDTLLSCIQSGEARKRLSSDQKRGPSAKDQEKIRQRFSSSTVLTFSDLCRANIIRPKESSRYDDALHRLKSPIMWAQAQASGVGYDPLSMAHAVNPPCYLRDRDGGLTTKINPRFGRYKETLPTLDGWSAEHGDHQGMIMVFVDHRQRFTRVLTQLFLQDHPEKNGLIEAKDHLQAVEAVDPPVDTSLFDNGPIKAWKGSMEHRPYVLPERACYQQQWDRLHRYYHYVDPHDPNPPPPTFLNDGAYVLLGEILPTLVSNDLYWTRSRLLADQPIHDTPGLGKDEKSVKADPTLFAHQEMVNSLGEGSWRFIRGHDVVRWSFPFDARHVAQGLEEELYQQWWASRTLFQRLAYVRWSKEDIIKTRPWHQ